MAPPECTTCLGAASVLPPMPTILSSHVRVNHEPAHRGVGGEKGDEVEEKDKGKGRDGDDMEMRVRVASMRMRRRIWMRGRKWMRMRKDRKSVV